MQTIISNAFPKKLCEKKHIFHLEYQTNSYSSYQCQCGTLLLDLTQNKFDSLPNNNERFSSTLKKKIKKPKKTQTKFLTDIDRARLTGEALSLKK